MALIRLRRSTGSCPAGSCGSSSSTRLRPALRDLPLRNFFIGIPHELLETPHGRRNDARIFRRIILPLAFPAIASFAVFHFSGVE